MSELTLSIAAEINSALQTIIGHCDLLERGYPDPKLQRDLATVVRQAQRIAALLDRRCGPRRSERLQEVEPRRVSQGGIPTSPEVFGPKDATSARPLVGRSATRAITVSSQHARSTTIVVATKNQSRMRTYSANDTTTRRIGVAIRTIRPASRSQTVDGCRAASRQPQRQTRLRAARR